MLKKSLFIAASFVLFIGKFFAQTSVSPPTILPLENVLAEAEKQATVYRENFNNFLSEETRTFEEFQKDGSVKKLRSIEANFLVYQSSKNSDIAVEYRNVTKVDGKPVNDNDKRAQEFFEKILKSANVQQELKRIREENSRYDKHLEIFGLTLNQAPVLLAHFRPFFDFQLLGRENINGSEAFVVAYKQKSKSPFVIVNANAEEPDKFFLNFDIDLPGALKKADSYLKGKFWIDANTFQLLREERSLVFQSNELTEPFTALEMIFEYEKSEFGFVLPKNITFLDFDIKRKDGKFSASKNTRIAFSYSKFSKSDVEVKSGDVKN